MATIDDLLAAIEEAPRGPKTCAIFDFDGTIISGYSATVFLREQIRRGDLKAREFAEVASAMASFGLGNVGFSALMAATAQFMRGIGEDDYRSVGEELYQSQIARLIYPEARKLIEAHRARGHTLAIISSATPYQVEPAAADLGIEEVMCTRLEVENGTFTGGVVRPTCFGQGKVDAAEDLAKRVKGNLDNAFFYSDSTDDLGLLERVGRPIALNPSKKLRAVAHDYDWPSADFGSRGRPTVTQFLRSVAATISLVPTFAASLPIYALTGSRREALNFSLSLFADTASALINLDLRVKGEQNLWSHRPAVFIFNHQSKADVIIIARLLRQDIAGVGKQEIRKMPVIGKVLELGGVVMIDRKNAASAIEAMAPLVDAMRHQGKSVAMAPEGTRSISPRLSPFKKGAFHLAIQAGVPIVPIVIHNAGDVAPKGDFIFRPATVDVEVLPPVDTSEWRSSTLANHVREVRNMFLKALGQEEEPEPAGAATRSIQEAPAKKGSPAKSPAKTAGKKAPVKKPAKTPAKKTAAKKTPAKKKAVASKSPAPRKQSTAARKTASGAKKSAPAGKARPKRAAVKPKLRP